MNQIKQHIERLGNRAASETETLNRTCNDLKKINRIVGTGIAMGIAFKALDVPTDEGIILGQYYQNNHQSIVDEIVSSINERILIDHKFVSALTFKMWFQRVQIVRGEVPEKMMLEFLEDSPALSGVEQDACDERVEALLERKKD